MSSDLSTIDRLDIEWTCQRLVFDYLRALDGGDWDALARCFAERGVLARPMQPDQLLEGREAIRASMQARPKGLMTRHLATNVTIDVTSKDTATGVTTLTMIGCMPAENSPAPVESAGPLYFGEFRDRFVKEAGRWTFLERRGSIAIKY